MNIIKKHFILLLAITVVYFVYVFLAIKPFNLSHFSLTDDGQVLMQNFSFIKDCVIGNGCFKFFDQTLELGTGRYRPVYWLIQDVVYGVFGSNPVLLHSFRVYFVGYLSVILLAVVLLDIGTTSIPTFLGTLLFFTTFSFSENVIRLGPNEPYQVIFLAVFSLFYLSGTKIIKSRFWYFAILLSVLVWAVFIKETDIVVLPVVFLIEILFRKRGKFPRRLVISFAILVTLFVLTFLAKKFVPTVVSKDTPAYTSNYELNPVKIAENAVVVLNLLMNSLSPYLKLSVVLLPILFVLKKTRKILMQKKIIYWFLFSLFSVGIMFPWKYLLERYLLVSIFGLSVLITVVLDTSLQLFRENIWPINISRFANVLFNMTIFIFALNLLMRGFPINLAKTINYSTWYAQFTGFESDQVQALLKYNNANIYINGVNNLNDWEFLYEIPIHFKFLYGVRARTKLLTNIKNARGYVFSRSSFDSAVDLDKIEKTGFQIVDSKSYEIAQVDPFAFKAEFVMKPIETVLNPPYQKVGLNYYWEIREINK